MSHNANYVIDDGNKKQDTKKKKEKENKAEKVFHEPLPIEQHIDKDVIKYVKSVGITDEIFQQGKMSREICDILSRAKL